MTGTDSAMMVASRALWDARPTTGKRSERFLANAMGYPREWRVVRRIVERTTTTTTASAESDDTTQQQQQQPQQQYLIVDRIYAGEPHEGVDVYLNHSAAQHAASLWEDGVSTGFERKGGQLLPRKPKFNKGDHVKVLYDDVWCLATVKKRIEKKSDGSFRYTVYYPEDGTTQHQVPEHDMQLQDKTDHNKNKKGGKDDDGVDPHALAQEMGFSAEWQAKVQITGKKKKSKKWTFISPDGKTFHTKTAAVKHKEKLEAEGGGGNDNNDGRKTRSGGMSKKDKMLTDEGDPPWRLQGHPYIGRRVKVTTEHQKSATRKISLEQYGTVSGFIADTDVDKDGNPGFISERTNDPANLFHVVFDDEPSHPYFPLLVESQDLEEYEVEMVLEPTEETGAAPPPPAAAAGKDQPEDAKPEAKESERDE